MQPNAPEATRGRWHFIGATLTMIVAMVVVVIIASIISKQLAATEQIRALVNAAVCVGGMTAALWLIAGRWLRVDLGSLGLRAEPQAWRGATLGTLLGAGLVIAAFAMALVFGGFRVESLRWDGTPFALAAMGLLATALHALSEELIFRAGLVGILKQRFSPLVAVAVPAIVFGLAHLGNPGASKLAALNVVIVGGAFGFLYLTGEHPSLTLVTGVHFGWNEVLYRTGIPVSGTVATGTFMEVQPQPNVWSGFAFGLEASPATTVVVSLLLVASYWRFRKSQPHPNPVSPPNPQPELTPVNS